MDNLRIISIDIETSGPNPYKHKLLAIGIAVIHNGKLEDSLLIKCYQKHSAIFDDKTFATFWFDKLELLESFTYESNSSESEMYANCIDQLYSFRKQYEDRYPTIYVSDNAAFDFGFLNSIIYQYTNYEYGFPYLVDGTWQRYADIGCATLIIRKLLSCDEPFYKMLKTIGIDSNIIKNISMLQANIHNPLDDAHRIGLLYYSMRNIKKQPLQQPLQSQFVNIFEHNLNTIRSAL